MHGHINVKSYTYYFLVTSIRYSSDLSHYRLLIANNPLQFLYNTCSNFSYRYYNLMFLTSISDLVIKLLSQHVNRIRLLLSPRSSSSSLLCVFLKLTVNRQKHYLNYIAIFSLYFFVYLHVIWIFVLFL
jgi:hypothetical protein